MSSSLTYRFLSLKKENYTRFSGISKGFPRRFLVRIQGWVTRPLPCTPAVIWRFRDAGGSGNTDPTPQLFSGLFRKQLVVVITMLGLIKPHQRDATTAQQSFSRRSTRYLNSFNVAFTDCGWEIDWDFSHSHFTPNSYMPSLFQEQHRFTLYFPNVKFIFKCLFTRCPI